MKVSELIKELKELEQDSDVIFDTDHGWGSVDIVEKDNDFYGTGRKVVILR